MKTGITFTVDSSLVIQILNEIYVGQYCNFWICQKKIMDLKTLHKNEKHSIKLLGSTYLPRKPICLQSCLYLKICKH